MNCRIIIVKMTESQIERQLLKKFINERPVESRIIENDFIFVLLHKKEQKLNLEEKC
jgi:hypothetical protein